MACHSLVTHSWRFLKTNAFLIFQMNTPLILTASIVFRIPNKTAEHKEK